jgi:FkbM family methyltransferase
MHLFYRLFTTARKGLERLGGECAWTLATEGLNRESRVLSAGAGHDISFELELIRRFGCRICLLDPSPTGEETLNLLGNARPQELEFVRAGLAGKEGELAFDNPLDATEGSFRFGEEKGEGGLSFPCLTVAGAMKERGWSRLDLLKIDIEGFEYGVLDSVLGRRLEIRQICVEFHHGRGFPFTRWDTIRAIARLRMAGYRLIHKIHSDHTFIKAGR